MLYTTPAHENINMLCLPRCSCRSMTERRVGRLVVCHAFLPKTLLNKSCPHCSVFCTEAPANTVTISTGVADVSARVFKGWMIVKDKKFWTPAREFCKSQFGSDSDLASLPREADNQRLANKLTDALGNDKDGVWVGLATDKVSNNKADWSWLDTKKTPAYSVWDTGYPNMISLGQACGILLPDNANPNPARWQNGVCVGWARAFVCEIKY